MLVAIISDSERHLHLALELEKCRYETVLYRCVDEIPSQITADITILPIPTKDKDGFLNLKGSYKITAENIITRTESKSFIITCNYECNDRKFADINKFEEFTSMNAIPSAEGAIFEAMKASDIPLFGSKTLVMGSGRIGKIIADRMKSFCSDVTIAARNPKDRYSAVAQGMRGVDFTSLYDVINNYDFIFQTVPHLVLTDKLLQKTRGIIIEVSSKCSGTDYSFAMANKNRLLYCPAIPEKYSKDFAAKVLTDSVKSILKLNKLILK